MINLTDEDNGAHISLKTGEQMRIDLRSNISTGYKWLEEELPDIETLSLDNSRFVGGNSKLIGSSNTRSWLFSATGQGSGIIALVYTQPWDVNAEKKWFKVTIEVV